MGFHVSVGGCSPWGSGFRVYRFLGLGVLGLGVWGIGLRV